MASRKDLRWSAHEKSVLRSMLSYRKHTYTEIANVLGRSSNSVSKKAARMGMENHGHIKYTDDFKKAVVEFYMQTDTAKTMDKFGLKTKQLDSLLGSARRKGILKTYKKERSTDWNLLDVEILLKYIGLQPLAFIAEKTGRSTGAIESFIKRRAFRIHYFNGIKKNDVHNQFTINGNIQFLRNRKGEIILPWTMAEDQLEKLNPDLVQEKVIASMAKFQRWIHRAETNGEMRDKLFDAITE